MSQRVRGIVVAWNDTRGYGFLRPQAGRDRLFFHVSDVPAAGWRPRESARVWYRASVDGSGRPCAVDVRLRGFRYSGGWQLLVASGFLALLAALSAYGALSPALVGVYALMSAVTVSAYRADKERARGGSRRIPERTLHLLEAACGWPGALVAQRWFRHKIRKRSYRVTFWCLVALNLAALLWHIVQSAA